MGKIVRRLIFWYFTFAITKSILSYFVPAPSEFSDAYIYAKMARNIFYFLTPDIETSYPILYPIILSISYIFTDMTIVYPVMKIINSLVSSLIIFPAWLISKEFMNEKNAFKMAILISLIPPMFAFSPLLMSENLFFPLFLFSFYFIYKSFISLEYKWDILAGIFIGLTVLTRTIGIVLIPSVLLFLFINTFRKNHIRQLRKKTTLFLSLILTFIPLTVTSLYTSGFVLSTLFGRYSSEATAALSAAYPFERIIPRFFIYIGYIILSSLTIFSLASLSAIKSIKNNYRLFVFVTTSFITILFSILVAINHGIFAESFTFPWLGGRVLGRYVAAIFPLVFILGGIGIIKKQEISKKVLVVISLTLIFSANLLTIVLFPINNMSLTYIGIIKTILENLFSIQVIVGIFALIFGALPFIFYKIYKKMSFRQITSLTIIFFIILGVLNYSVIAFNSYTYWYKGDQMQLGIWFNNYDKKQSTVLFDIRDTGEKIWKQNQEVLCDPNACIMGFWINDKILIGHPDEVKADYIISKHELNYPIIKEQGGIYIYESNNHNSGI